MLYHKLMHVERYDICIRYCKVLLGWNKKSLRQLLLYPRNVTITSQRRRLVGHVIYFLHAILATWFLFASSADAGDDLS